MLMVTFLYRLAGENSIICNDDGSVQLYHDNVLKCQTRDFGFSIFQDLNISNNLNWLVFQLSQIQ